MPLNLRQASRLRGDAGKLLPDVFDSFTAQKIQMRRGHLYLVAAAPGIGKSVVALNLALLMRVPTQYFSLDGDNHTMSVRVVQACALTDSETAESHIDGDGILAQQAFNAVDWIRFDFPSSPDTTELAERVWAYAEIEGRWPEFIVVDNLMDVAFDDDEARGLNAVMNDLAKLARATGAAVLVLHHVTGQYEDGHTTIPQSGLRFKVAKKPDMILTLNHGAIARQLWVSVVKNRFGPADPAGLRVRVPLEARYEHMKVFG